jgi:hypothetical protein
MMPATTTTSTEHLALDGPIPVAVAVLVVCALLWLFAWSLRRERDIVGKRNVMLFWLLRAAALGIAVWMLLGPSSIHFEQSTTRQTVAIAVDVSRSMQTVDPVGTADDLRWSMTSESAKILPTVAADRSEAAARMAEYRLHLATTALQNQQPERMALESAARAHDAVMQTREGIRELASRLRQSRSQPVTEEDNQLSDQVAGIRQMLDGTEFERLSRLATDYRDGRDAFATGWRESLADLEHQLIGIRRRLSTLAQRVAARDRAAFQLTATAAKQQETATRLSRAAMFVDTVQSDVLAPLSESIDVRYYTFESSLNPVEGHEIPSTALNKYLTDGDKIVSPQMLVTDIAATLEQLRLDSQEQPLAAIFLVTDVGHNNPAGRDPREAAAELAGVPVYVVPIGNPLHVRDVDVKSVFAPNVVMKDDDVVIEATLQAYDCEGESCRVELLRDGVVVQHRDVPIESAFATRRVRFDTRIDEVGTQRFQVRVAPLKDELSEDNNFEQFEVNVTRNQIEILLADEMSRWEFRYLAQLFRRDATVECDELLFRPRLIATGHRKESQAFPTTTSDWNQYDVVLLGDVATEHLPVKSQEALVDFLRERGGTLVVMAGEESMPGAYSNQPLEEILPVTKANNLDAAEGFDGYAFQVTNDGWKHHALMIADTEASTKTAWEFINHNSPMRWLSEYRLARPAARTLISAVPIARVGGAPDPSRSALLCWQSVGRGRIVYVASPETYRLRYMRGDRLHYRFWGQLLRWAVATDLAAGSEMVSVRTDRSDYRTDDNVEVVVRLNNDKGKAVPDANIEAVAIRTDDVRVTIPLAPDASMPGRYLGRFDRLETGVYRVEPTGEDVEALLQPGEDGSSVHSAATASFTVRSNLNRELLDTRCDRALAQQIADATGGQVLPPTAIGEVLKLTDLEPIVTETTESLPLWVQWKFLWIVFGCLFSEWVIRKRMGLS